MGCGASDQSKTEAVVDTKETSYKLNENDKAATSKYSENGCSDILDEKQNMPKDPAPTPDSEGTGSSLPAREKNIPAPLLKEVEIADEHFLVSHYAHLPGLKGATFAIRDPSGCTFAKAFTDSEFSSVKESKVPQLTWNAFWRALSGSFTKEDCIRISNGGEALELTLRSSKEPKPYQLSISMTRLGMDPEETFRHFISPFTAAYKKKKEKRTVEDRKEKGFKEEDIETREALLNTYEADIEWAERVLEPLGESIAKLGKQVLEEKENNAEVQKKIEKLTKSIRGLKDEGGMHPLDGLYSVGGARQFQHSEWSAHYVPKETPVEPAYLCLIDDGRIKDATPDDVSSLTRRPTDPDVMEMVDALPDDRAWQLVECFEKLDKWDFDTFLVDEITSGGCLLYTSYTLFVKYGFMEHFKIPKDVVVNFFSAVQAGYLPNHYHNSTHAADVMQITHYILGPGGMSRICKLSEEDKMAAIISAAIHDYNHPGLNNNFHTRVSAYLSTLYNDRSVLENHHCACAFELLNHPKFDILATLNDDQRKDVRDTIVEMLLSTDMGNHAKIFSAFRRRQGEAPDWSKKKEDVRLAMVMAIKLADISNCGRPKDLYLKWANRIAEEFYAQGDAEARMLQTISPFMDRRKHDTDFHKGQTSFMSYIVAPLFESVGELLPRMRFALDCCKANREHWGA